MERETAITKIGVKKKKRKTEMNEPVVAPPSSEFDREKLKLTLKLKNADWKVNDEENTGRK